MKRYVITHLIEVYDENEGSIVRKPDLPADVTNWVAAVPQGANAGEWVLVKAAGRDLRSLNTHPDIEVLPDFPHDAKISAMGKTAKDKMFNGIARVAPLLNLDGVDGYRDVIRRLGQSRQPTFHEDNFDVAE